MKPLLDLSFRYKIPLWGGLLILISATAVTLALLVGSYDEVEEDLRIDAEILGHSLANNLLPAMQQDDVWRAYEIVGAPLKGLDDSAMVATEIIMVVDDNLRVFVSDRPKVAPIMTELAKLGADYGQLAQRIPTHDSRATDVVELPNSRLLYFLTPISDGETRLGTVIIAVPNRVFLPRFFDAAWHGCLVGAIILAVLLPINWYWGQRMASPLVLLAARMAEIGNKWPDGPAPASYPYRDELGNLFDAYNQMLKDLKTKHGLENQMVQSERLAALGQLAAGIAHEINNPLSGMLTAIDTLKRHRDVDPRTGKTIDLIERGLNQVKDTVGALLVEARLNSRNLTPQDIEDVLTLVTPQARKKALHLNWHNSLDSEVDLPATMVRQILINLLLNAVQAAADQGEVCFDIGLSEGNLCVTVKNDGKMLSADEIAHLFEPFSPLSTTGHGLGLWVTYQIVHQLGGHVIAERDSGDHMRFAVNIPVGGIA